MSFNAKLGKGLSDASKTLSLLVLATTCHSLMLISSPPAQAQFMEPGQFQTGGDQGAFNDAPRVPGRRASLGEIDEIMNQVLQQFHVPGGACAVAHDGKLVYAKGFGVANLRTGEPATPTTLFNLASCTKAISAFGALRLQEQGQLNLDTPFWDIIGRPMTANGELPRPRIREITVRQLLHHSGGWNDDSGFDTAGKQINRMAPNGLPYSEAVRVLLQTPLDYPPGTQAKYANGQWNLIKYVIECASQEPYGRYMKKQLRSIGIEDMVEESPNVVPGQSNRYGGNPPRMIKGGQRTVPLMPSFGNWMASSIDLVKFLTALDGSRTQGISPDSFNQLVAPLPPPMQSDQDGRHFGLGLDTVRQMPAGISFMKDGAKPGVHCQIVHMSNGVDFCVQFNGGSSDNGDDANPAPVAVNKIRALLNDVKDWPAGDLFANCQ
jgi:N-acyl-D-amino-acid deacylase